MTIDSALCAVAWKASSGKFSKARGCTLWRVTRDTGNGLEELRGPSGQVRYFLSRSTAERAAEATGEMCWIAFRGIIHGEI